MVPLGVVPQDRTSSAVTGGGTDAEVVVVGAGIVGLATARELLRRGVRDVLVLEKESGPARHQTGRNSGVVHSGLYYSPGSDKALLVARGRREMVEFCRTHALPLERIGKVVVATRERELGALAELERRAIANGVRVRRLDGPALREIEPHVSGLAALHVPDAAITNFGAVANALATEVRAGAAEVRFGAQVLAVETTGNVVRLSTTAGAFTTRWLVNCAGLHSDRVARLAGAATDLRIVPFRGEYRELTPSARHLVRALVYPVPDPRWPFLGVHLTPMIDGSVHVGPNAVLALGREAYERGIDVADTRDLVTSRGLRVLARRYWRTGLDELVRSRSPRRLLAEVRRLVPELEPADLVPSSAGIRAQAITSAGALVEDFAFATSPRAVHVLNAPSPAATASLAIAAHVADRLDLLRGEPLDPPPLGPNR